MAAGMMLLPLGDAVAKFLTTTTPYDSGFLAWSRFVVGCAIVVPIALLMHGTKAINRRFLLQQALRGLLVGGAITFIISAVKTTTLADTYGGFFIGPALATVLARTFLKERPGRLEWIAVALGFFGVALVVRPSFDMNIGLVYALAAGCCYGGFLVATRWSAGTAPPMLQLAAQLVFSLIFFAPLGIGDLRTFGIVATEDLLLMGIVSAAANLFAIMALGRAAATYLAPVVYLQILSASTLSWFFFEDRLDDMAKAGLLVIVVAGLTRIPVRWRKRQ